MNYLQVDHIRFSDPSTKEHKAEIWKSNDAWGIKKTKETPTLIYIENISKNKVLGATNDCKVILQDFAEDNPKQLWKEMPFDTEDYFVLENFEIPMVLTAVSFDSLKIKGMIAMLEESNEVFLKTLLCTGCLITLRSKLNGYEG